MKLQFPEALYIVFKNLSQTLGTDLILKVLMWDEKGRTFVMDTFKFVFIHLDLRYVFRHRRDNGQVQPPNFPCAQLIIQVSRSVSWQMPGSD